MRHRANLYHESSPHYDYLTSPAKYFVEPFEILPGLWYVGDEKVSCHLVDTGDGLILFDASYPHTKHLLVESIYRAGFSPRDVKYLILSHGHYDHVGAANDFRTLYGCKVCLGRPDVEMIASRPELTLYEHADSEYYAYPEVDIPLDDGDVIALGSVKILAKSTPGHTDGVMSFFFDLAGHKVGYFGGSGINTLTTAYYREFSVTTDNRANLLNSARYVYDMDVDVVLGNHPAQSDTFEKMAKISRSDGNPFVDATEWKRRMDAIIRSVEKLEASDPR